MTFFPGNVNWKLICTHTHWYLSNWTYIYIYRTTIHISVTHIHGTHCIFHFYICTSIFIDMWCYFIGNTSLGHPFNQRSLRRQERPRPAPVWKPVFREGLRVKDVPMPEKQHETTKKTSNLPISSTWMMVWWTYLIFDKGDKKKSILATQQLRRKISKFPALKSGRCSFPGV